MYKNLFAAVLLMFLFGCASQKYAWNGYDDSVYAYYKNPADKEKFIQRLKTIILNSERAGKVPPGIYAEYGYMFYENHNFSQAIIYFQKEHDLWPESRIFMEKMIKNAQSMMSKKLNNGV